MTKARRDAKQKRPRVAVLYHYFHPDDVVSARIFTDFCLSLAQRGWEVEVWPSNRGLHDESASYPLFEQWQGLVIHRVWRPAFRQTSGVGRLLNSAWMLAGWCRSLWRRREAPDVIVVGTDPVLSLLVAPIARKLRPRIRIAHWCFDLYPECPIADGMLRPDGLLTPVLRRMMRTAYAACDLVADLGPCMRKRLDFYQSPARQATLVPWALTEPDVPPHADLATRRQLFGDSPLGLLYSGNYGRAHACADFLELARRLRTGGVHFCFGVRGNRADELRAVIRPDDANVSLAGFAPESELDKRLGAADIHLVSLRPEWSGLVVPSKFFGALAVGRPVLFAGPGDCAIAQWIAEHDVGWVLEPRSMDQVAAELRSVAADPQRLAELQRRCHRVYHENFSRSHVMDRWHRELTALVKDDLVR